MNDPTPRGSGFAAAVIVMFGAIAGLVGGTTGCFFLVTIADRIRIPPIGLAVIGFLLLLLPALILFSRRRPTSTFAIGALIGLSLSGLLLGACGTLLM